MIPNPFPGHFIVFEGIDGCGKTVQLEKTAGWLRSFTTSGLSENLFCLNEPRFVVRQAKEPNKEKFFGKKIYADLTDKSPDALHKKDPHGFQSWYASDSKENLRNNIIPALKVGSVVLCDRFRPSMVYGAQTEKEILELMKMNREIIGEDFIWPDLILIFDLAIDTAIRRLKAKNRNLDEHERAELLNRVRTNYLHFAVVLKYPNCQIIGAEKSEEEVFENVKNLILPVIESRNKKAL